MSLLHISEALVGAAFIIWLWSVIRSVWVGMIAIVIGSISGLITMTIGFLFAPEIGGLQQQIIEATSRHKIWLSAGIGAGGLVVFALSAVAWLYRRTKANYVHSEGRATPATQFRR